MKDDSRSGGDADARDEPGPYDSDKAHAAHVKRLRDRQAHIVKNDRGNLAALREINHAIQRAELARSVAFQRLIDDLRPDAWWYEEPEPDGRYVIAGTESGAVLVRRVEDPAHVVMRYDTQGEPAGYRKGFSKSWGRLDTALCRLYWSRHKKAGGK